MMYPAMPSRVPALPAPARLATPALIRGSGYRSTSSIDSLLNPAGQTAGRPNRAIASAMGDFKDPFHPVKSTPVAPSLSHKLLTDPAKPVLQAGMPQSPSMLDSSRDQLVRFGQPNPAGFAGFKEKLMQAAPVKPPDGDAANLASRARMIATYAPVADRDLLMRGALPAVARRTDLTPEQQDVFIERRNERQAELDLRKQRQFARAQLPQSMRQAGSGVLFDDDGNLDFERTMAVRAFLNQPSAGIEAVLGLDTSNVARERVAAGERAVNQKLILDADESKQARAERMDALVEKSRQFDATLGLDERRLDSKDQFDRRMLRIEARKLSAQDRLARKAMLLDELKALEELEQGDFDRSEEKHRRDIDLKKTMPYSTHESPYLK